MHNHSDLQARKGTTLCFTAYFSVIKFWAAQACMQLCDPRWKHPLDVKAALRFPPRFLPRCCTHRRCLSGPADLPLPAEEAIRHAGHYPGLDHWGSCSHPFWLCKSWTCSITKARLCFSLQPERCCSSTACQYLTSLSSWIISPVLNPTPLIPTKWVCFQRSLLVKYW